MKALNNYIIVGLTKEQTTTKQTKSGLYILNQEKTDTTKDGDKVVTTHVTVLDIGPKAYTDLVPGDVVALNYYVLQMLPSSQTDGITEVNGISTKDMIIGVIEDKEVKVVFNK